MRSITRCYFPLLAMALIALLATADYFLFREYELVWPFFFMPYAVMLMMYLILYFKYDERNIFILAIFIFIIIPVFAGLTMSIAWMAKIDFWGEQIRRISM